MRDDYPDRNDEKFMVHTMAYLTGDQKANVEPDHMLLTGSLL
jgi:succinate dehydrogenase / fumarate reductase, flavoprotein subunit